ncbi:MAG TPA: hypothetical protein VF904_02850 [Anaeromyxobacteraceae bacterium]
MRAVLAAAMAALVLLTGVAPHAHGGPLGAHTCVACVAAGGEEAACETPDVAPRPLAAVELADVTRAAPVTGFPLGAIPGQSPPSA